MALLESITIPLGTPMPDFTLADTSGTQHSGKDACGAKGLLVAFTCNHCPYAIAVWPRLIQLAAYAQAVGINTVAINPNINPDFPEDSPEKMKEKIREWNISFPYLIDKTQEVAHAFKAQCTPDVYLFNNVLELVYHGRIDDNWKDASKVTREELKDALAQLSSGQSVSAEQKPSMGCSIKWVQQ